MRPSRPILFYNNIYQRNIQRSNIYKRNSSSSTRISNNNNEKDNDDAKGKKNYVHIKKLIFKQPQDSVNFSLEKFKHFKARRLNSSFEHLKKINYLFSLRLPNKRSQIFIDSYKLPKLSFNTSVNNKKSKSISYEVPNKLHSNLLYNPNFPFIKKLNIAENKRPKNIDINDNNFNNLLKKRKQMSFIKDSKNFGVNSIYLSFKFKKQRQPPFFDKYINLNNSERILNNLGKKDLNFQKLKKIRTSNFNYLKGFNSNKSEFKINYKINDAKTNTQNAPNFDSDLLLNDKGTLISFYANKNK